VIEAIFENLPAKQALFADIERLARPEALLASNTSSLRLADIAHALQRPERLVGIHFFNPVAQMPLVEVVASPLADPAAAQQAAAFVRALDKLPLPVADSPGFLVNAVLAPYLNEAMRCVDEGIAPATVDAAMRDFGMPMGPIELADTVGLDIALAVGRQLIAADRQPQKVAALVAEKHLGKKSGQGYYIWRDGRAQKPPAAPPPAGLRDRLLTPLLQAAADCVARGVVADADLADAGVIFGTGFAPYTGGPLNYRQQQHEHDHE
jgi:3-hydroxyacyl-CoA dehydrogenase/enoyl-CoA hydratase/3-hydroxybutyryl-CoA epimerase